MKKFAFILAAFVFPLLSGFPYFFQDQAIQFKIAPYIKGQEWIEKSESQVDYSVTFTESQKTIQEVEYSESEKQSIRLVVLDAEGPILKKVKMEFSIHEYTSKTSIHGDREKESPLHGNSFIVTWEEGEIEIEAEDGTSVKKEVLDKIKSNLPIMGIPNPLSKMLSEEDVKPGEEFELPKKVSQSLIKSASIPVDPEIVFEFREVQGEREARLGLFRVRAKIKIKLSDTSTMTQDLLGECWIAINTGRIHRLELKGDISIEGEEGDDSISITLEGSGVSSLKKSLELSPKKD